MVPRNGFEVIESVAAIANINNDDQDDIGYLGMPIDILTQHIINICLGAKYSFNELLTMCKNTHTYANLSNNELQWVLDFCCNKHTLLKAYPEHVKLIQTDDEYETNATPMIQKTQRFNIGAITSDEYLIVKYTNQRTLGIIEEQFIRQLNPNDSFLFSGHVLSVKRIHDDIVYVKKSNINSPNMPDGMVVICHIPRNYPIIYWINLPNLTNTNQLNIHWLNNF